MSNGSSPSTPSMAGTISPAIFQPGYTPPDTGSGLGLAHAHTHGHGQSQSQGNGGGNTLGADVPMPMPGSMGSLSMGFGMGIGSHHRQNSQPNPITSNNSQRSRHPINNTSHGHSRTLFLGEPISLISNNGSTGDGNGLFDMNLQSDSRFPTTSTRSGEMDIDRAPSALGQVGSSIGKPEEDTLPSAALRGFKMPFEGMLAEGDEPMVMS
jgi:hypothetical protein